MIQRFRCLLLTATLLLLAAQCKKMETPAVSATNLTTSRSVALPRVAAKVPAGGSLVKVSFRYTICHVFGGLNRAIIIRGDNSMPHTPVLIIPNDLTQVGLDALRKVTGRDPEIVGGKLEIALNNIGIQVVDSDGGLIQPALDLGEDFDALTPHLKAITAGKFSAVRSDLSDDIPDANNSPVVAYFVLSGGHLSADPQCSRAKLGVDADDRRFADVVSLTGTTPKPAVLQLRSKALPSWTTIAMKDSDVMDIRIENRPGSSTGHFPMHAKLADPNLSVVMPTITKTLSCEAGLAPGCSNTQWP
jgi:hypothetical protein